MRAAMPSCQSLRPLGALIAVGNPRPSDWRNRGAFRSEWGVAYEGNLRLSECAVKECALTEHAPKTESAMGTASWLKLTAQLGRILGEHAFATGGAPQLGMTKEEAVEQIGSLTPGPRLHQALPLRRPQCRCSEEDAPCCGAQTGAELLRVRRQYSTRATGVGRKGNPKKSGRSFLTVTSLRVRQHSCHLSLL